MQRLPSAPARHDAATTKAERSTPRDFVYRVVFGAGVAALAAFFLAGLLRNASAERSVPGLAQDPLAEARRWPARGHRQRAIHDLRTAVVLMPGDWSLLLDAAGELRRSGDLAGSLDFSEKARALRPSSAAPYLSLGATLFLQRRFDEAMLAYQEALRRDLRSAKAYAGLGEVLLEQDRFAPAAAAFAHALEIDPRDAAVHNSLGITLALAGQPVKAVEHFAAAVDLAPSAAFLENLRKAQAAARPATK